MRVNITFLVRNRPRLTQQSLVSLCMTWSHGMDLTILDDRSDMHTQEILHAFDTGKARVVRNTVPMGTGLLRNTVVGLSEHTWGRGDYLYLSDNDVWFGEGWLEQLVECYEFAWKTGTRVLGAYNHPFHQPIGAVYMPNAFAIHELTALATQSMLMRWEVWDTYGPFCQTPVDKVCQSEDVDFTNRIRAAGFKIGVVSPALIASTGFTNTFGEHIPGWELVKAQAPKGIICE